MDENSPFTCDGCDWTGPFSDAVPHATKNPGHVVAEILDDSEEAAVRVEITAKPEP